MLNLPAGTKLKQSVAWSKYDVEERYITPPLPYHSQIFLELIYLVIQPWTPA